MAITSNPPVEDGNPRVNEHLLTRSVVPSIVVGFLPGLTYDSVDFFGTTADSFRIPLDRDLHVAWRGTADWFGIECRRYLVYGNQYYVIGEVLDSITTTAQVTIPQQYFFQDTSIDDSTYDFLYVSVIGVNGPKPDRWNDLSSFGGTRHRFGHEVFFLL